METINEVKALSSHYPPKRLTHAEEARWLSDYADDLAQFSGEDVRLACQLWRVGEDSRRMPSPGELIAKCRNLVKAEIIPLPARTEPEFSEEHKAEMRAKLAALAQEIASTARLRRHERLPGENDVDVARRLWPNREVKPK